MATPLDQRIEQHRTKTRSQTALGRSLLTGERPDDGELVDIVKFLAAEDVAFWETLIALGRHVERQNRRIARLEAALRNARAR